MAKTTSVKPAGRWLRILRPLSWWLLLVLALFGIRTHQRLMEQTRLDFTVTLAGQPLEAAAMLDRKSFFSGQQISLGSHTFAINQPKAEPFTTSFFAWYGNHDLGRINLKRSAGTLSVQASPPAAIIFITGPEFSTSLSNSVGTNLTVPTDSYMVTAEYPHWSQSQNVTVFYNQPASCVFSPQLGALHLTCNRDGATYQLQAASGQNVGDGNLPDTLTGLPAGIYQLTASYHNHQVQNSVLVEVGKTNECRSEFIFGAARLESVPSGATVRDANGSYLGETPLDLPDMTPQRTQFNLSLSDYQSVLVNVGIVADQTNTCRTNLVSLRYLSAMQDARAYMVAKNYAGVVQSTGEALNSAPGDADALALQNEANTQLNAELDRANAEHERQARLTRPKEVFDALCAQNKDAGLFEAHELKTSRPAKDVQAAIAKALQADPSPFQLYHQDSPQPNVYEMLARHEFSLGILGGSLRICLLVVGQTKDGETQILFKVLEYQEQHTVVAEGLAFHDEKQVVPLNPSRIQMTDMLQLQVQEGVRTVTERIQKVINTVP